MSSSPPSSDSGSQSPPGTSSFPGQTTRATAQPPIRVPSSSFARASTLISILNLQYLPHESGYIGLLDCSSQSVVVRNPPKYPFSSSTRPSPSSSQSLSTSSFQGPSQPTTDTPPFAAQSHNYYLLTKTHPVNFLHWLASDDIHILIEGGPVAYYIFHPPSDSDTPTPSQLPLARAEKVILGHDVENGQRPIVAIKGGRWKALVLDDGAEYALMGNVLAPEWTDPGEDERMGRERRVRIGEGREWVQMFKGKEGWTTEDFLRGLVGQENWKG